MGNHYAQASTFVPGHNKSHHEHLETEKDIMLTSQVRFKHNALNLLWFMFSIQPLTQRNDYKYFMAQRAKGAPIYTQLLREIAAVACLNAALAAACGWRWFAVVYVPNFVAK